MTATDKLKIIIGAGDQRADGYITCDFDPATQPNHVFDLERDRFPFDTNSVDTVIASHVLEHLGDGYFHCLQELYRVCCHGAIVHVHVPHHRHDDFFADPTHRRPITVDGLKLFGLKYNRMSREQGVHASRLAEYYRVDFEVVHWEYRPVEKYREMFESQPRQQVQEYLEQHCNIIDEVYIKLMVIKP
jgi:ubiquinone/menaquinone biosynthesis C-methylase UbiE